MPYKTKGRTRDIEGLEAHDFALEHQFVSQRYHFQFQNQYMIHAKYLSSVIGQW